MMRVRDWMTTEPLQIEASSSLTAAIALLALGEIRHLPVVDATGRVVGMLSERDVIGYLAPESPQVEARLEAGLSRPVGEVMSADVVVLAADSTLREANELFLAHRVGAFPVVERGVLVGILSYIDVLRALRDKL